MYDPYASLQTIVLPNGLTIHCNHIPNKPQYFSFIVHSGSAQDPVALKGLAHFVEHMVFHCSELSELELQNFFLEASGTRKLAAWTSPQSTWFTFAVPLNDQIIQRALNLCGQILMDAKFSDHIETERSIIIQEFRGKYSESKYKEFCQRNNHLYGDSLYGNNLGDLESIAKISQLDLQNFYDEHYTPANISVLCVGGMGQNALIDMFTNSPFSQSKEGKRFLLPYSSFTNHPGENTIYVEYKEDATASRYNWAAKIPSSFSDASVEIMTAILQKLLFAELRTKRQWIYDLSELYISFSGAFYELSFSFNFKASVTFDEIDNLVQSTISSVAESDSLFNTVKKGRIKYFDMLDASAYDIFDSLHHLLKVYHKTSTLTERKQTIENITFSDITKILPYLDEKLRWTIAKVSEANLKSKPLVTN